MPTLTAEQNPPPLAIRGRPAERLPKQKEGHQWYLACVKSRQEKKLAFTLLDNATSYYLPMEGYQAESARYRVQAFRLLFPGYLFFYATPEERVFVREVVKRSMYSLIPVQDEWLLRKQLRQLLKATALLDYADFSKYQAGRVVQFFDGPLVGLSGGVIERRGESYIQLRVPFLGAANFRVDLKKHAPYMRVLEEAA